MRKPVKGWQLWAGRIKNTGGEESEVIALEERMPMVTGVLLFIFHLLYFFYFPPVIYLKLKGAAKSRPSGLLQTPIFLCSYVLMFLCTLVQKYGIQFRIIWKFFLLYILLKSPIKLTWHHCIKLFFLSIMISFNA